MTAPSEEEIVARAVELVAGEVPAILSSWARSREGGESAADDAVDLLAAWAHLQRFDPERLPEGLWNRVNTVVSEDADRLSACVPEVLDPTGWLAAVDALRQATDNAFTEEEWAASDTEALFLFQQLDEADLAVWAAGRIREGRAVAALSALEALEGDLQECMAVLVSETDLFVPVRSYAGGLLTAYRKDLMAYDADLWYTVAKYQLVAEAGRDLEQEAETPPRMSREAWHALCTATMASRVPASMAAETASVPEEEQIEFKADDGSWKAFLSGPAEPAREDALSLWVRNAEGTLIPKAEAVLCGIELAVTDGYAKVPFEQFWDAVKHEGTKVPLTIRWQGSEHPGRGHARSKGRPHDPSG